MKRNPNVKGAWRRRPLGFRLLSIFYTLLGALEYATFPLMMLLLITVHKRWVMVAAIAMYFTIPTVMRPLEKYVREKGKVFALEELRKALKARDGLLDSEMSNEILHSLTSKVLCFRDFYYESLTQWSALIYIICSIIADWFLLPRALNNIYILTIPVVLAIMMYSEDRIMHVSGDAIRKDIPVTEEFIKLVWLTRDQMTDLDTNELARRYEDLIEGSEKDLIKGVNKCTLLSFSEYVLVFLLFICLSNITKFSLELSLSLFVSLPVFIEGVKALSELSRHFLRARAMRFSIDRFVTEEEA